MQLDLNCLLEEINIWKNIVKKKDEKIKNLQNQIKENRQHIESIDNSNSTLLQEVIQQNSIISSIYQSLSVVERTEADNKALVEEIKKLKCNFKEQEKLHLRQSNELKKVIEKLEADRKEEIKRKISAIEDNVSSELEKCEINIREKENCILLLKDEISKIEHEKVQEILKIQIECEEKLGRMKSKISKNKGVHHHDFKSNDFFRQKYMEKEKEAKEESMKLKKEINDLKGEVASLKSNSILSFQQENMREQFHVTEKPSHCSEENHPTKRIKINGESPHNDTTNGSHNDFNMCNFTNNNTEKQPTATTLFKKKLFNLDMNYFNK
ncbi:coiled-coil domain-containing protein 152 [Parasteatoda tepidariorum]|uniref:coiled-coil domain-containing protein 152 n=1 Tax=Parasteatoda tepidariorum TaxID=114398 RepID=UPI001C71BB8A|nr:coiled-coil domain-containing protein 18 [Parasteatoda tepidariorum]